jgi:hypothetical protein
LRPSQKISTLLIIFLVSIGIVICITESESIQRGNKGQTECGQMRYSKNVFICDFSKNIENAITFLDTIYNGSGEGRGRYTHKAAHLCLKNMKGPYCQTIPGRQFCVRRKEIGIYSVLDFKCWRFTGVTIPPALPGEW